MLTVTLSTVDHPRPFFRHCRIGVHGDERSRQGSLSRDHRPKQEERDRTHSRWTATIRRFDGQAVSSYYSPSTYTSCPSHCDHYTECTYAWANHCSRHFADWISGQTTLSDPIIQVESTRQRLACHSKRCVLIHLPRLSTDHTIYNRGVAPFSREFSTTRA